MKRRAFIGILLASLYLRKLSFSKEVFMIVHASNTRGFANHGWLQSWHTFSFANYYNPERMGFGALRVINDDTIEGGQGFGTHPHRDMEIITIPLAGALRHRDSEGHSQEVRKGEVQIMSAGTGIFHSEFNASAEEPVSLLQIWVLPKKLGIRPRYDQKAFAPSTDELQLVVSPDGRDGSLSINQDAFFSLGKLEQGKKLNYEVKKSGNGVYVFIIRGSLLVNGDKFDQRDGVGLKGLDTFSLEARSESEVLIMEVPA